MGVAVTVTADGWIEVTGTVDGWIGDTVVSCTDVVIIVAVEDGDAIATISCGVWETSVSGTTGDKVTVGGRTENVGGMREEDGIKRG